MVDYNIVKHCKICGKRFVVGKKDAKMYFCKTCQTKIRKGQKNQ